MELRRALNDTLRSLYSVLTQLHEKEYAKPFKLLSGTSIGSHTKHIIEFFLELEKGYKTCYVNYDNGERYFHLGNKLHTALDIIVYLERSISKVNKSICVLQDWGNKEEDTIRVSFSYNRELLYNLEHCIHHMAILRLVLTSFEGIHLAKTFGVAFSTLKHEVQCVK